MATYKYKSQDPAWRAAAPQRRAAYLASKTSTSSSAPLSFGAAASKVVQRPGMQNIFRVTGSSSQAKSAAAQEAAAKARLQSEAAARLTAYTAAKRSGKTESQALAAANQAVTDYKTTNTGSTSLSFGAAATRAIQTPQAQSAFRVTGSSSQVKPQTQIPQPKAESQLSIDQLLDKVLLEGNTTNLQQYDWWSQNPNKEAAWNALQRILTDKGALVEYVSDRGINNLQSYWWWSNHPDKQEAWEEMEVYRSGELPYGPQTPEDRTEVAQDLFVDDDRVPEELKPLFDQVVKEWNPEQDLNIENILIAFNKIADRTIDPYYSQLIKQFVENLKSTHSFLAEQQGLESQQAQDIAKQNIQGAREALERSGMTFTGKGIEELGAASAFGKTGSGPLRVPFGGNLKEGRVQKANRLMSSSLALRQKQQLAELGRQGESALGSSAFGALKLGLPSTGLYPQGSIDQAKQQAYASAADRIKLQQSQSYSYQQPYQPFQ